MTTGPPPSRRYSITALAAAICAGVAVESRADLDAQVRAIFEQRCAECHSGATRESGLSVETLEDLLIGGASGQPAITPGHPERSLLILHTRGQRQPRMPHDRDPLTDAQVQLLEEWIRTLKLDAADAAVGVWWAYRPLRDTAPPAAGESAAVRNPIDRFILARLAAAGLEPAPPASPQELLRRAYFDLLGVPPTPREADAFLTDESPEAWQRLIDRLLDDPRYGERWGRHWLDLARYADTQGFESDRENYHIWRYRDYVIRSFNADKPYDRFVREQLAGDELWPLDPEARIATGFLRLGPVYQTTLLLEMRQLLLNEITSTVGQVFLAQTIACAQCHDHKYDPVPQRDFYRLQAFFAPMELLDMDVPFAEPDIASRAAEETETTKAALEAAKQEMAELEKAMLERLAEQMKAQGGDPKNANRLGLRIRLGAGDEGGDTLFSSEERRRYRELMMLIESGGDFLDRVPGRLDRILHRYEPKAHAVRTVIESGMKPSFSHTFVRIRGEYDQLGEHVRPGFPVAVAGHDQPAQLRTDRFGNIFGWRAVLADWIASPDNPLTARVMVNRIWQHHFGRGLVATPSDFGRQGARPTHPELVDWLAQRFIDSGWSIKSMHRLIMNSATYRQSSRVASQAAEAIDPANRLLWRFNRRRLEAEAIRDSVLAVAGMLNPTMYGPGVFPPVPEGVPTVKKNVDMWETDDGPGAWRRSVYIFQRRQLDWPVMSMFDAPVLSAPRPVRPVSTTPLQALAMFNGEWVDQAVEQMAQRVQRQMAGEDASDLVIAAWRLALGRAPDDAELSISARQLAADPEYGLRDLCRVLLNTNEFIHVD